MAALPAVIASSHLWQNTLAAREHDEHATERERLRSTLSSFRERAALLATEIRKDLTQLTVHDISHLDALWETASTIVGKDYTLTPTEGFILGGAFLLHDLGMSLAAVEGGLTALQKDSRWADLVTYEYQSSFQRNPTTTELESPNENIKQMVLFSLLRQVHAENAEKLAFLSFKGTESSDHIHLIDDTEMRQTFGRVIGRIAHSHWWSLPEVERQFSRTIGPPHWCPPDWTIDPLKIACLLRVADAAQIDSRRAPLFLKTFSCLSEYSSDHWTFQQKLNKPYLGDDALVFTTGRAFQQNEAGAWWLCLETLKMVDSELASVDSLFADKGNPRFAARRIAGVDSPERLVSYIQTEGWLPINATIHVTDLPRVIKSLGGEELYGKQPLVALRELVQNASDAIQARRVYEGRGSDYGSIEISLTTEAEEHWLEVYDDGIGMSQRVLTDFLLDFGRSFWGSAEMQQELPGLLASGIKQTGKYGIGFFSVFMVADLVQVITRRADAAVRETLVLEFSAGLKGRPILRDARRDEQLINGGTRIKLKLKSDPFSDSGILYDSYNEKPLDISTSCLNLCPALEVNLFIIENGSRQMIITGGDWKTLESDQLLKRMPINDRHEHYDEKDISEFIAKASNNLRFLKNNDGEIVGRALITAGFGLTMMGPHIDLDGFVVVGGLKACGLTGVSGILCGKPGSIQVANAPQRAEAKTSAGVW